MAAESLDGVKLNGSSSGGQFNLRLGIEIDSGDDRQRHYQIEDPLDQFCPLLMSHADIFIRNNIISTLFTNIGF